ncbi:MaoC/PaaZ C-terminal domain-containing protein [Streptomyces silvensis]|uniref:Dehydratase n=1 Tax=Streptomyces silvensis TaxID=1765722 RepID=A0A0W7X413_9ACTN|nr:MaoC/PaaZ C-terminal domain-containing protein [Streptomyces silvensis]KUF17528.1 dehydratase [Streptomyces silvensis]
MTSLALTLLRGAALSAFKRARPDAPLPGAVTARVRADVERLVAYERLCGFAAGRAGGAGGGDPLPVTYPHVLAFPGTMRLMAGRDFPLPLLGLVHTSVEIVQHHALLPADELELTTYAETLAPHRRGTEATVVTRARLDGTPVWESRSTYLSRHRTPEPAPEDVLPVRDGQDPQAGPGPGPSAHAQWRLTGDLGRRYATVSGDRNPIHLHPLTARLFGFPRAIAHGMWTFARCVAEHQREAGSAADGGSGAALHVSAEFRAPVLLPCSVTYAAAGEAFALRGPTGRVHLSGAVRPAPPRDPGGIPRTPEPHHLPGR